MTSDDKPAKPKGTLRDQVRESEQQQEPKSSPKSAITEEPSPEANQSWNYLCAPCDRYESGFSQRVERCPQCGRAVESERTDLMPKPFVPPPYTPEYLEWSRKMFERARRVEDYGPIARDRYDKAQTDEERQETVLEYVRMYPHALDKDPWLKPLLKRFPLLLQSSEQRREAESKSVGVEASPVEAIGRQPGVRTQKKTGLARPPNQREGYILECRDRKGEDYAKALDALGATTPLAWRQEGCPKKYTDAYHAHPSIRGKWRKRIWNQKHQVVTRFLKPQKD